ncbi:hypothetical protein AYO41_05170 [Verrucomicrobia bacterium SCGC AG-212-E04]|nr:hypothetical protein AYO41_05170 [Verrucomicrobia bacterium SCGC AG-212-E04]
MKTLKLTLALLTLLTVSGCATTPMTTATEDTEAKQFTPPKGKANIYVYRGGGVGAGILFPLTLDGRKVGAMAPETFACLTVSPGNHTVALDSTENAQQQVVDAKAGASYFFRVESTIGLAMARVKISAADEATGKQNVSKYHRSATIN